MVISVVENTRKHHLVAVIGAGPAGLYASQYLARKGVSVALFNRDIRPGGLAEYGIFPSKRKMRQGLLSQFKRILRMPNVHYFGNITVGQSGDIKLDQFRKAGFQAFMVTTGAQENKWLGLPGEDLEGVYQANDIVFNYNHLPEKAHLKFDFGSRVSMIGMGNVMLDIAHYLKLLGDVRMITAYARRGPTEVKFDKETLEPVANCLNLAKIKQAVDAAKPELRRMALNAAKFYQLLVDAQKKAEECEPVLELTFEFLRSPRRLIGDDQGHVKAMVFEINRLEKEGEAVISQGTGNLETVLTDTVIFSIGSRVDEGFGLPVAEGNFITSTEPRFPVDGISYEVFHPDLGTYCEDIFVSGWARQASEGIVGLARRDAERGARAVLQYLETQAPLGVDVLLNVMNGLPGMAHNGFFLQDLEKLWEVEANLAVEKGIGEFKFQRKDEILKVIRGSQQR